MKRSVYGTVGKVTNFPTAPVDKIFVGIWTSVRDRFWWELSSICSKFEQASRANRRARFSRWAYADEILSTSCPLHLTDAFGHENVRRVREGFYFFLFISSFASLVSTMCGKLLAGCRYNSINNNNNNNRTRTQFVSVRIFHAQWQKLPRQTEVGRRSLSKNFVACLSHCLCHCMHDCLFDCMCECVCVCSVMHVCFSCVRCLTNAKK